MAPNPAVYPVTSSVSSTDLVRLESFSKVAPPYVAVPDLVNQAIPARDVYNTITATTTATLAAGSIVGGWEGTTLGAVGTLANATGLTLPTVAATVAAIAPTVVPGQTQRLRVINKSSANFVITILTSTGWTLSGSMTVAQNTWRDFIMTFTSLTAATLQEVGTGTDS